MSHFTVAVIHDAKQDIDMMLAPYSEELGIHYYYDADLEEEYTYNPSAKWDWYSIGGRWDGLLKVKDECIDKYDGCDYVNEAPISDIDFSLDPDEYDRALAVWDYIMDGTWDEEERGAPPFTLYNKEYYLEYYGDRETYARSCAEFGTFAVMTPDGTWFEKGEMGWWGLSSVTPEESRKWDSSYYANFIKPYEDKVITIVDCHI